MLITALIYALVAILGIAYVILPLRRFHKMKEAREFANAYRVVKLRAVRRHYESLRELSWSEIEREYDLDDHYNKIH